MTFEEQAKEILLGFVLTDFQRTSLEERISEELKKTYQKSCLGSNANFEKWWPEFSNEYEKRHGVRPEIDGYFQAWQVAYAEGAKAALGSRVPLTAEQVMPSDGEIHVEMVKLVKRKDNEGSWFCDIWGAGFTLGAEWLRSHIAAKLGDKKDGE